MRANWAPSSLHQWLWFRYLGTELIFSAGSEASCMTQGKNIHVCLSYPWKKGDNSSYTPQIMAKIVGHSNSGATQMALGMYWIVAVPVMPQEKFSYWSKAWETPSLWEIYLFPLVFFHITPTFKNHWWTCYSCIVRNVDLLKLLFSCWKEG